MRVHKLITSAMEKAYVSLNIVKYNIILFYYKLNTHFTNFRVILFTIFPFYLNHIYKNAIILISYSGYIKIRLSNTISKT